MIRQIHKCITDNLSRKTEKIHKKDISLIYLSIGKNLFKLYFFKVYKLTFIYLYYF